MTLSEKYKYFLDYIEQYGNDIMAKKLCRISNNELIELENLYPVQEDIEYAKAMHQKRILDRLNEEGTVKELQFILERQYSETYAKKDTLVVEADFNLALLEETVTRLQNPSTLIEQKKPIEVEIIAPKED